MSGGAWGGNTGKRRGRSIPMGAPSSPPSEAPFTSISNATAHLSNLFSKRCVFPQVRLSHFTIPDSFRHCTALFLIPSLGPPSRRARSPASNRHLAVRSLFPPPSLPILPPPLPPMGRDLSRGSGAVTARSYSRSPEKQGRREAGFSCRRPRRTIQRAPNISKKKQRTKQSNIPHSIETRVIPLYSE